MVLGYIVTFVVALLVGGFGIYVGALFVTGEDDYGYAVMTAIVGAIAWALTSWIPLLGPIIALVVWVWVINWRYEGGWTSAALIGLIAWLAAGVVLYLVNSLLNLGIGAFGIPGV